MSNKERLRQLAQEAEIEQEFLNNPAAVDPFISLSTRVILVGEKLMAAHGGDPEAVAYVRDQMEMIKQDANNVLVDLTMRKRG